ncbi:MAG TPA: glycosyltransferase [Mucilaginibacter sp.]|nr:glycosyltransferase [Mucilaginibacter sp.]
MEIYLPEALFALLSLCFIAQLYYLLYYHRRLYSYQPEEKIKKPRKNIIPVSVIISARNEAKNLPENLPVILEQNYPDFEVIVVNDCSLDESEEVLKELCAKYPQLKVVNVTEHERFKTGKKFALTMGIKASKNEHLIFTDADCRPASANWISRMVANFSKETGIVLGYSPYYASGNFLNPFIRFETLRTAINYLSAALAGNPYMGIGRNLAYTKTLFFTNKGFASHMHVISGDDDLFVNENATAGNTVIEIHPEAFTYSPAKGTFSELYRQKRRHMGVGKLYKNKHRRMLSFDALSGFFFYVLFVLCLALTPWPLVALGLLVVRMASQLILYYKIFRKLDGKNLIWYLPFFDLVYYVYLNIFGLIGTFIKTTQWK